MDLRTLPDGLSAKKRCDERRHRVEEEAHVDLSALSPREEILGHADERNCEQMIGHIPLPIGYAGPLMVTFASGEKATLHLPLATTEGALVASVNRGCKALTLSKGVRTTSIRKGTSRSLAFKVGNEAAEFSELLKKRALEWTGIAEGTSGHLKMLGFDVDVADDHAFLTIHCDTDEAMGMNMATIAAQAVGDWLQNEYPQVRFVTVAGNVDSDKKPSTRTKERGRGFEATAEAVLIDDAITQVLKTDPDALLRVARAKLELGSHVAGALGSNLHAANIIAALYLATGQDAAHVVEGSLADTTVSLEGGGVRVRVRLPAMLVGVRGGGTELPAQKQCLSMLLKDTTSLHPSAQLAESIAAAVLAGEVSLLAAQAKHSLAKSHAKLARGNGKK
jgi:hydroxymethylglutaryl-CoA reductase (NADPH)